MEVPVSVGDKVYRTTRNCSIQTGEVTKIEANSGSYKNSNKIFINSVVKFTVNYGYCDKATYKSDDLGSSVFLTKGDLIKHIVDSL